MDIRIALAGNPNSGKTTLFNALTGSNQYVGNWPGVTVEKKEGQLRGHPNVRLVDLPGIYSLSPYTPEEIIARDFLLDESPDAILNLVDGTNLERNLYLTTQLLELGIPVVIAINMMDVVKKAGDRIDIQELARQLGCPVVEISALRGTGLEAAANAAIDAARKPHTIHRLRFGGAVEHALAHIEEAALHHLPPERQRWNAIKIFERDALAIRRLGLPDDLIRHVEQDIVAAEQELDDESDSIISNERYQLITGMLSQAYRKVNPGGLSVSDRIDLVVTNRFLALPIFALIMFLIYYLSVTTVGSWMAEWTNDVLFGQAIAGNLDVWMTRIGAAVWLKELVIHGIVAGTGSVLGFVPQMVLLFLMLSILEDVGYMARVAFITDRLFRKFGLSGKSFIPLLIGSGCSVPGIMASRTIDQERDRRMTIMTTSFVPCGAKMPIIALFAGALFGGSGLVATSAYFIGFAAVVLSGLMLKKLRAFAGKPAPFVMELPAYHQPSATNVLRATWERVRSFIVRAGTIILLAAVAMWFLQAFGFENGRFGLVTQNDRSLLAAVGGVIAPIFTPLGFGSWKPAVATLGGLIGKENIVSTLGILYDFAGSDGWRKLAADFTPLAAYSFLIFNLLCAPCMAAVGAIRREMNSARWTWAAIGYMTAFAWVISLIVYQIGNLLSSGAFGVFTAIALAFLAFLIWAALRADPDQRKRKARPISCIGCPSFNTCNDARKAEHEEAKKP